MNAILTTIYLSKTVGAISKWKQVGKNSAKVKDDAFNNTVINLLVSKVLLKARIERYRGSQNRSQR